MNLLELNLSPAYGGLELHTRDFSQWLSQKKDCRLFLALQKNTRLADALKRLDVPTLYYSSECGKLPLISAIRLAKYITEKQIDVVHVHWKNDLPLVALAKRLSKHQFKFVHTRQMNLPAGKQDPYHRFIYNSLDCFIAITDYLLNNAKKRLPLAKDKITRVYYGTRVPSTVTADRMDELKSKFQIGDTFTVGLFGRISEFKGQHLLIEAVQILKEQGIIIDAFIIGEAFEKDYFNFLKAKIVTLGTDDQIHFMDFYKNPHELMACFDCIVLTTQKETFGLVLIEAMQVGVAVIGSDAGGVPEIIDHEDTGLLFEPMSAQSLAAAIKRLATDVELRNKMAAAGQKIALAKFDLDIQFQEFYDTIRAVADKQ